MISIGLHLLVVLLWGLLGWRFPGMGTDSPEKPEDNKLVFQLIEIPDEIPPEEPDAFTNLVSDRSTRAADSKPEDMSSVEVPYSEGDAETKQYQRPPAGESSASPAGLAREEASLSEEGQEGDWVRELVSDRSPDRLEGASKGPPASESPEYMSFRNLLASAEREGGIRFNTYDWDFAPYMLAMKRAIESHMYPPYAFTHMGLVSGTNVVRFTVLPDGQLGRLEILSSDTHYSLDGTSVRAIELSAPFMPLPKGFPEDYLEVTAHFSYVVRK